MAKTKKDFNSGVPVEKHDTAAWADVRNTKPRSKVALPSGFQVENAKEYADENRK